MIKIFDLTRQVQTLKKELDEAWESILSTGQFILGPQVRAFESEFSAYLGCSYAIGTGSGTGALSLAYQAIGLKPSDRILTTPTTYVATAMAAAIHGGRPEFVDIRPDSGLMDLSMLRERLENAKRQGTLSLYRAIVPVHLYGYPEAMEEILSVSEAYGIPVIEDACQAHGAWFSLRGQKIMVGTVGVMGCFSFYPTKNLGAFGDGGMVVTNNPMLSERLKMLRNYGQKEEHHRHYLLAGNNRLDELQAACLRVKLPHLDRFNQRRREIAAYYSRQFADLPLGLPPVEEIGTFSVQHLYVIRTPRRNALASYLTQKGVGTAIHYPTPIHLQPAFKKKFGYRERQFPHAERFAREILSLPMYPELTDAEVEKVASAVRDFF